MSIPMISFQAPQRSQQRSPIEQAFGWGLSTLAQQFAMKPFADERRRADAEQRALDDKRRYKLDVKQFQEKSKIDRKSAANIREDELRHLVDSGQLRTPGKEHLEAAARLNIPGFFKDGIDIPGLEGQYFNPANLDKILFSGTVISDVERGVLAEAYDVIGMPMPKQGDITQEAAGAIRSNLTSLLDIARTTGQRRDVGLVPFIPANPDFMVGYVVPGEEEGAAPRALTMREKEDIQNIGWLANQGDPEKAARAEVARNLMDSAYRVSFIFPEQVAEQAFQISRGEEEYGRTRGEYTRFLFKDYRELLRTPEAMGREAKDYQVAEEIVQGNLPLIEAV